MQCEGWRRYGGAFSIGSPVWKQCENDAVVTLTVVQEEKQEMPACLKCWNEAKESGIVILNAEPIAKNPAPKAKKKTKTVG